MDAAEPKEMLLSLRPKRLVPTVPITLLPLLLVLLLLLPAPDSAEAEAEAEEREE